LTADALFTAWSAVREYAGEQIYNLARSTGEADKMRANIVLTLGCYPQARTESFYRRQVDLALKGYWRWRGEYLLAGRRSGNSAGYCTTGN